MLKAMGIEDEKVEQIIEEHVESVDALKAERDRYKAGAEEAEGLRRQLEEAKAAGEGAGEAERKLKDLTEEGSSPRVRGTVLDWLHRCGQFREGRKRREGRI